jgi:hypothetical protein
MIKTIDFESADLRDVLGRLGRRVSGEVEEVINARIAGGEEQEPIHLSPNRGDEYEGPWSGKGAGHLCVVDPEGRFDPLPKGLVREWLGVWFGSTVRMDLSGGRILKMLGS